MERLRPLVAAVAVLVLLAGCDALFTTSPLAFLQRDPADMSLDQRINYAEQALASGDLDAIKDAYDAIKDDAAASADGDLNLLAAQLAMELSGLPDVLTDLLSGDIDFTLSLPANEAVLDSLLASLDDTYTTAAAGFYLSADSKGGTLNSTDYFMGALAVLAAAAQPADHVSDVTGPEAQAAADWLSAGIAALGLAPGEPSYDILHDLQVFLEIEF